MSYTAEHVRSRIFQRMLDFDPGATSATLVTLNPGDSETCLALADNGAPKRYMVGVMHSVGTGTIDLVEFIAATAADGTGATAVITKVGTTANAVGDTIFLECDVDQIRAALPTATHLGVRITLGTGTDECVVTITGMHGQHEYTGLTADYIS